MAHTSTLPLQGRLSKCGDILPCQGIRRPWGSRPRTPGLWQLSGMPLEEGLSWSHGGRKK